MKRLVSNKRKLKKRIMGFTLAESVVALGIVSFALISGATILTMALKNLAITKSKTASIGISNELMELYRNFPYDQIGTTSGWPSGAIPDSQQITRSGMTFTATTRVDYIDDPFDGNVTGTIPGKPQDTMPNDYKRIEVKILTANRLLSTLTTIITPNGLEAAANAGSLILHVSDFNGNPFPEATVTVTNSTTSPPVNIVNTTDIDGNLQLLSLPPATDSYHITVTKAGYTTDATIDPASVSYTPLKPDLSLSAGSIIEMSFSIDLISAFVVSTIDQACQPIADKGFQLTGINPIGINPDTVKYSATNQTGADGTITLQNMEGDTYNLGLIDQVHDIAGGNPSAIVLPAGVTQNLTLILAPHSPNSLLLTVNDANTGLPLTDATVDLSLDGNPISSIMTGRGFFTQTDWSGGSGQAQFADADKFWSADANIDQTTTAGSVTLSRQSSDYAYDENFSTVTYLDSVATTAVWDDLGQISLPQTAGVYDPSAAAQTITINSANGWITDATLTVADNPNGQTIRYLLSSDGGLNFDQVAPGTIHSFALNGSDLRLRIEMETTDTNISPTVDGAQIAYSLLSYLSPGTLESSTFDTGTSSVFQKIQWKPTAQIQEAGPDSVKFQVAANSDNSTWNFVGPDNTAGTYYAIAGEELGTIFDNNRYVRYKLFLSTADPRYAPAITDTALGYTSGCTPPGQVFFNELADESYTIDVAKTGYTEMSLVLDVSGQAKQTFNLTPE